METKPNKSPKARKALMSAGIAFFLILTMWFYLTGGRYISTDNAYIKGSKIVLVPEVSGTISKVAFGDNDAVKKGDALLVIDPEGYQVAVDQAKADLLLSYSQVKQLKAHYKKRYVDLARAKVDASYTADEFNRYTALKDKKAISEARYNEMKRQHDTAEKNVLSAQEFLNDALFSLQEKIDIPPDEHPLVKSANAVLSKQNLDLERTVIKAPIDGIVRSSPSVGEYARAGVPIMNLVGTKHFWINANFKETELEDICVGQPVSISIDTYPGRIWKGTVQSISPASEAEFSLLPAQNSSGNWVKVVQRFPVKIAMETKDEDPPLRAGMSTHVTIDTGRYPNLPTGWN